MQRPCWIPGRNSSPVSMNNDYVSGEYWIPDKDLGNDILSTRLCSCAVMISTKCLFT